MKHLYFTILLFCSNISFGQFSGFGFNAGGNGSTFVEEPQNNVNSNEQQNKIGGNVGIKLEWKLFQKDWLKLSPELYFIQKGSKEYLSKQGLIQAVNEKKLNLDYSGICVPLKIDFNGKRNILTPQGYIRDNFTWGYLQANFYADYTFGASSTLDEIVRFNSKVNRIDYGFVLNGAISIANGVYLQVGYHRGVKNIEFLTKNEQVPNSDTNYIVQNKNFTVAIAYLMKIN